MSFGGPVVELRILLLSILPICLINWFGLRKLIFGEAISLHLVSPVTGKGEI